MTYTQEEEGGPVYVEEYDAEQWECCEAGYTGYQSWSDLLAACERITWTSYYAPLESCVVRTETLTIDGEILFETEEDVDKSVCCETGIEEQGNNPFLMPACELQVDYDFTLWLTVAGATPCSTTSVYLYPDGTEYQESTTTEYVSQDICCAAYLEGVTSDVDNFDACSTAYENYAFSPTACTADLMPLHPTDPDYIVSAITTDEVRPSMECCD